MYYIINKLALIFIYGNNNNNRTNIDRYYFFHIF